MSLKRSWIKKGNKELTRSTLKRTPMSWSKGKASKYDATDKLFSRYIRFKDASKGYIRCITCNKIEPPEDCDAGHYISREFMTLRYDERNVHPQCRKDNRFKEGLKDEYALALIRMYGPDILEELNKEKHGFKNYSVLELKEMRKDYRKLLKEQGKL